MNATCKCLNLEILNYFIFKGEILRKNLGNFELS